MQKKSCFRWHVCLNWAPCHILTATSVVSSFATVIISFILLLTDDILLSVLHFYMHAYTLQYSKLRIFASVRFNELFRWLSHLLDRWLSKIINCKIQKKKLFLFWRLDMINIALAYIKGNVLSITEKFSHGSHSAARCNARSKLTT